MYGSFLLSVWPQASCCFSKFAYDVQIVETTAIFHALKTAGLKTT